MPSRVEALRLQGSTLPWRGNTRKTQLFFSLFRSKCARRGARAPAAVADARTSRTHTCARTPPTRTCARVGGRGWGGMGMARARAPLSSLSLSVSTTPYSVFFSSRLRVGRSFRGEAEVLPPRERLRGRLGLEVPRLGRTRGQLELPGRRPPVQGEATRMRRRRRALLTAPRRGPIWPYPLRRAGRPDRLRVGCGRSVRVRGL